MEKMTKEQMQAMLDRDAKLIADEQFELLMDVYTEDAIMILRGGETLYEIQGKEKLKAAHQRVAKYFNHDIHIEYGNLLLFETEDTILALAQAFICSDENREERRSSHVYRKINGQWLCAIDNSYGTDLLSIN